MQNRLYRMNLRMNKWLFLTCVVTMAISCQYNEQSASLPILGNKHVEAGDTVYHTIPDFQFINQDSQIVNKATFKNKAYIVDFFFTSCPTICPKVKKQMLRIYEEFEDEHRLKFLSHSIDTRRDTVLRLRQYAENLGVESNRWHFVTGDRSEIYEIADDYFSVAIEDPDAPGGFDHSGRLILVDGEGHIRSFCDGTSEIEVDRFMDDIRKLLDEMHDKS